jgi:hypothetical protein
MMNLGPRAGAAKKIRFFAAHRCLFHRQQHRYNTAPGGELRSPFPLRGTAPQLVAASRTQAARRARCCICAAFVQRTIPFMSFTSCDQQ